MPCIFRFTSHRRGLVQRRTAQQIAPEGLGVNLTSEPWVGLHGTESRLTNHTGSHGNESSRLQFAADGLGYGGFFASPLIVEAWCNGERPNKSPPRGLALT